MHSRNLILTAVLVACTFALGRAGAHILALAQSTSSYHISFMLPEAEVDTVVRMLHADLGLA